MSWSVIRPYLIGGGAALLLALVAGAYVFGRQDGKATEQVKVEKENVKTIKKVAKDNAKVDRNTPYGGSAADVARFLLDNARAD